MKNLKSILSYIIRIQLQNNMQVISKLYEKQFSYGKT